MDGCRLEIGLITGRADLDDRRVVSDQLGRWWFIAMGGWASKPGIGPGLAAPAGVTGDASEPLARAVLDLRRGARDWPEPTV